jgi:hypothetical protein
VYRCFRKSPGTARVFFLYISIFLTKKIIMIALTHVACLPDWQTFGKCDIGKLIYILNKVTFLRIVMSNSRSSLIGVSGTKL